MNPIGCLPGVRGGRPGSLLEGEVSMHMTGDLSASARLFDVANIDDEVIDVLEGLIDTLKESRQAKADLAALPAADLRAVLMFRANRKTSR